MIVLKSNLSIEEIETKIFSIVERTKLNPRLFIPRGFLGVKPRGNIEGNKI